MSNHKARTWDHRESKPLDLKFLPLDHHLDDLQYQLLIETIENISILIWFLKTKNNSGDFQLSPPFISIVELRNFFIRKNHL